MDCSLACLIAVVAIREQSFLRAVVVSMPCSMEGAVRLCHAIGTGVRDESPAQLLGGRPSTMDSIVERSTKEAICLLCDLLLFWKLPGFNTPMGTASYTLLLAFRLQRIPLVVVVVVGGPGALEL